uniref:S-locus associated ribonuclease n=3 Tax=Prunus armeniaca TaxID=36596 RepID=Q5MQL6_PRUAR|nr:S4-RNase protein [Prunus armeniaca]ADZ73655.1 S-locus associated ribonuclease [Prunus armeniaca]
MAMLKSPLAFLVLAFALFLCFIMSTGSYVYFQFVQQWPPATCIRSKKPCSKHRALQNFTIHGLWPSNYSNPTRPSNCVGSHFNESKLSPQLISKLRISWPDVESGNDTQFWEGEWNKHGKCSQEKLNQMQYFERSHDMWMSYNITDILKNASIVPHPTQTWTYSDIVSAIKSKTQRTPLVRCKRDPAPNKNAPNSQLLHEVVFCYEYKAKKQIDCNRTAGCWNNVDIKFPP